MAITSPTLSKFLSRLHSKRNHKKSDPQDRPQNPSAHPPPDTRPPLVPSPLPLVLPSHQHLLPTHGWTTLTFPTSAPHTDADTHTNTTIPPHPLPAAAAALFAAAQSFFSSPDAEKARWKTRLASEEGWTKIPGEKEFITLRTLDNTPDVLRQPAARYWALMGALMDESIGRISTSLGLSADAEGKKGLRRFVGPCAAMGDVRTASMLRIFRYEGDEAKVVAEPHADLGLLSAVVGDVPGLEVWDGVRGWVDVERGYAVGNGEEMQATYTVGRTLERLSNGRYPAGGHRVVSYGRDATSAALDAGTVEKRYRHSIVFVLRAHEPVLIDSSDLTTSITGAWAQPASAMPAGKMYEEIRGKHFNINIGHEEREKQRRNVKEGKAGRKGEGGTALAAG